MRLPQTLTILNAALAERRAEGLSDTVIDIDMQILEDPIDGAFVRFYLVLTDGDSLVLDSKEPREFLEAATLATRRH